MKTPSAAWNILVSQITHLPILNQTFVAGSSSEGWSIFKRVYAHQSAAEKARLTQSWYGLNIKDREPTNEYFARCNVLTSRLSSDGLVVSDKDTKQHFARNLSPAFGVENGILLSIAALTYLMLEDVVLSAHEEMDISREQDLRSGTGDEARLGRTTTRVSHSNSRRSTSSTSLAAAAVATVAPAAAVSRATAAAVLFVGGDGGSWVGGPQQWGTGGRGPGDSGKRGRCGVGRAQAVGDKGRDLPSYPPPSGSFDYCRYPWNLPVRLGTSRLGMGLIPVSIDGTAASRDTYISIDRGAWIQFPRGPLQATRCLPEPRHLVQGVLSPAEPPTPRLQYLAGSNRGRIPMGQRTLPLPPLPLPPVAVLSLHEPPMLPSLSTTATTATTNTVTNSMRKNNS